MNDLIWKDEYSLGIPAVDFQHRRIFDCFVTIANEGPRAERLIVELADLLQQHFALEEKMMQSFGYPDLERHIEEHRQFHADVCNLAQASLRTEGGVQHAAARVLKRWQQEHVMTSDGLYVKHLLGPRRNGADGEPDAT
jgi:hemerythrin-like metal-binding protein